MENEVRRKCQHCGTLNINRDYCKNCGELINGLLKRKLEREAREKKREERRQKEEANNQPLFEKLKEHPNPIVRFFGTIAFSVWVVVIAIGTGLAFLVAYIAA